MQKQAKTLQKKLATKDVASRKKSTVSVTKNKRKDQPSPSVVVKKHKIDEIAPQQVAKEAVENYRSSKVDDDVRFDARLSHFCNLIQVATIEGTVVLLVLLFICVVITN